MSGDSQNYRPRSPDLSACAPQPLNLANSSYSTGHPPPQHRGSYDASPFFSPQATTAPQSYFGAQPYAPLQTSVHQQPQYFNPLSQQQPPSNNFQYPPYQQHQSVQFQQHVDMHRTRNSAQVEYLPQGPRDGRHAQESKVSVAPSHGIDVKTKFPVARIKRIMQADEDVGKVAQAAPTAVSKALELFMITLVTKAATEAKEKSSKRISAQHLKAAIAKDEVLDFLNEIIEKVPDAAEAKGKHRAATDSPEADEGKKKRNARRKKSEGDD